jgi:hypothetical protein
MNDRWTLARAATEEMLISQPRQVNLKGHACPPALTLEGSVQIPIGTAT